MIKSKIIARHHCIEVDIEFKDAKLHDLGVDSCVETKPLVVRLSDIIAYHPMTAEGNDDEWSCTSIFLTGGHQFVVNCTTAELEAEMEKALMIH